DALAFLSGLALRLFLGGDRGLLVGLFLRLRLDRGGLRLLGLGGEQFLGALAIDRRVIFARDRRDRLDDRALLRLQRTAARAGRLDERALDRRGRAVGHQQRHQRLADLEFGDLARDVDL